MTNSPVSQVTWLKLDPSKLPKNAHVNFSNARSALGPLFTAAISIDFQREAATVTVTGAARFKVPLKGEFEFRAEAHAASDLFVEGSPLQFDLIKEEDIRSSVVRTYMPAQEGIEFRKTGAAGSDVKVLMVPEGGAPVHSPLLVLPALASTWNNEVKTYGAVVVAGTRFYALRLQVLGASNASGAPKGAVEIEGTIALVKLPLTREAWSAIKWDGPGKFVFSFDPTSGEMIDVGFNAPIIGRVAFSARASQAGH